MEDIFLIEKLRKLRGRVDCGKQAFLLLHLNQILAEKFATFALNFNRILLVGSISPEFYSLLKARCEGEIFVCDISPNLLDHVPDSKRIENLSEIPAIKDKEFDLIYSYLDLHHINNVPGYLIKCYELLAKKGIFMASFFGGNNLPELRAATMQADMQFGGVTNRVFPFIEIKTAGMLLQKAGFSLVTADSDNVTVMYPEIKHLYQDLKDIAETNILKKTHSGLMSKERFKMISDFYQQRFSEDGEVPANFEFVHLSGVKD